MNTSPEPIPPQSPRQNNLFGLLGIFLVAMGCLILVCVVGSGYLIIRYVVGARNTPAPPPTATLNVQIDAPTPTLILQSTSVVTNQVDLSGALQTLQSLRQSEVPIADPLDLAQRLQGKPPIAATLAGPPPVYQVGDAQSFWIVNDDTDQQTKVQSKLVYITPHLYFWIQVGVSYNATALKQLCETFENKIYPTDRKFFGSEWTPGVDDDPHLYILMTRGVGSRVAGYFSSADEIPPAAFPYSNGHEMFVMNADSFPNLAGSYIYSVLAHEFQHMIHWYRDRNEESWMNEGFSELAAFLNGYGIGGFDAMFASNPDLQLTDWPNDKNSTAPHYGASFLFLDYFLNRFGEKATQTLVGEQKNGLDSVDQVLTDLNITAGSPARLVTADDVFTDWTLANYLDDPKVGDGRFSYPNYPNVPNFKDTETIRNCPVTNRERTVSQYGTDYIRISCRGNYTLSFQGNQEVGVLPANPHSGSFAFWSNKGDESDMTLTQTFDLTGLTGKVDFTYWTWYDLETNYDFLYLEASKDGGATWQMVKTPSCTEKNISGTNYGCGYNGKTNGWIQEKVDLSTYAGQKVTLRFEYVTDAAVNGEGFLLDDVEIPQLGYKAGFESGDDGWTPAGFVRMENKLPQTYRVSLIQDGQTRSIQYLTLNADESLQLPMQLTSDVTLVVSGTTRYTRIPASYTFSISP